MILLCLSVNYCDTLYSGFITSVSARRIQNVQNSCIRLLFGMRRREHVSGGLVPLRWLNMSARRALHCACSYYKVIYYEKPPYLYNKITFRSDVHNVNVRFRGTLTPPTRRTQFSKRSFTYQITSVFNSIPRHIRTSRTIGSFRQRYFAHLFLRQSELGWAHMIVRST